MSIQSVKIFGVAAYWILTFFVSNTCGVSTNSHSLNNVDHFKYCLRQTRNPGISECIGRTALNFLQRIDAKENYTLIDDLSVTKDENAASRSLVNFMDTDPVDFRGILENAGGVFSQRNLEFHMDAIYPGLMFKIGPTSDSNSVAEFVMDSSVAERDYGYDETSTARIIAKQYLLPFLLGLKFKLVALVPLLFAFIALLLKKSLFFVKLAIYVSSLLGIGGAVGALGGLGGLGGIGGLFGGPPIFQGPPPGVGVGVGGIGGYFPGKTTVFTNNYANSDELSHNSPYKRTDRKMNFNKPREYVNQIIEQHTTTPPDHFYEYEQQTLLQERSGNTRSSNAKLRVVNSQANTDGDAMTSHHFHTSDPLGWQAVDPRV